MEQQMVLPEGGLASFLTSNLDEIDDSRLAFGSQNGINSMRDTAERMAQFGRNGDDVLIHATKNERLIPVEVSEANPELMSQVDIALSDAGADPSAYIVGNETNSVNPYTGQSEFFFKKLIKNVKNVFKKLAPIIVPFALNFIAPGLGAVTSGFIGSGITGLVQGKSFKESLKMGFQGALIGGISQGFSNYKTGKTGGYFTGNTPLPGTTTGETYDTFELRKPTGDVSVAQEAGNKIKSGYEKIKQFASPKAEIPQSQINANAVKLKSDALTQGLKLSDEAALAQATKAAEMGVFEKYGGTALTIGAGALALGAFDPIEAAELEDPYSKESESEKRLRLNRSKYSSGTPVGREAATLQDIMVGPIPELYQTNLYEQYMTPQQAAAGGQMESFPRRTGYIAGPGTETSDDIPAMLSDGEFVMNAKAVRGAGGGSREKREFARCTI